MKNHRVFLLCLPAASALRLPAAGALRLRGPLPRMTASTDTAGALRQSLEKLCEDTPNNGVGAPPERQEAISSAIAKLEPYCAEAPARIPLDGVYELLYCSAKGGSNGKVGPFVGSVTQSFIDDIKFINAVSFFGGAVKLSLFAERKILDDAKIQARARIRIPCPQ